MIEKEQFKSSLKFLFLLTIIIGGIITPFLLFRNKIYVITSPSMAPSLNVGDLVISEDINPESIKVGEKNGDIIIIKGPESFYDEGFDPIFWNNLSHVPIIHRAIDKKEIDEKIYFKTKGDNNPIPDGAYKFLNKSTNYILIEYNESNTIYICETEILGIVVHKIPCIGYLKIFFPFIFLVTIYF